mgnify:CR=1 FL=1
MTTKVIEKSVKSNRSAVARRAAGSKTATARASFAATTGLRPREAPPEKHPVDGRGADAGGGQPFFGLATGKARVDQETHRPVGDEGDIAATAAPQDRDLKRDGNPPV